MPYNTKRILYDGDGKPVPVQYNPVTDSYQPLQVMEYYGATVANRPSATAVPVGAVYCAIQTQEYWQSDGTQWVVV